MLRVEPAERVKSDFFIELYAVLSDRNVKKMPWFKRNWFIDRMLDKYETRAGLKAVTDFRIMKQCINNAVKAKRIVPITRRLREFTTDDSLPLSHLELPDASHHAEARRLTKLARDLTNRLADLETDTFYGEQELWIELEKLLDLVSRTLARAGWRQRAKTSGGHRGQVRP
jgi:hypothetical protein